MNINDTANGNHMPSYDGNGNVAQLAKASDGTVSAQYEYGPFGEVLRRNGTMAKVNPFRFSTKYQDDESDLLYYGFRYYGANVGRWLDRDPIAEPGFSRFAEAAALDFENAADPTEIAFVRNNPETSLDYLGTSLFCNCDMKPPPEVVGPLILTGVYGKPGQRLVRCTYANIGELATYIIYPACLPKSWFAAACYNCYRWNCKVQRSYICSRTRTKGGVRPEWHFVNDTVLKNCSLRPDDY